MFNIIQFLEDEEIEYWLEGNNVGHGGVNIRCPFCDDSSNHLGMVIRNPKVIRCWRCGTKSLNKLIEELGHDPKDILERYDGELDKDDLFVSKPKLEPKPVILPPYRKLGFMEINYLHNRGFDKFNKRHRLYEDWGIFSGGNVGEFKFRIIVPIYQDGKLISYQGRDYTGNQTPKYKNYSGANLKDTLYGIDGVKGDRVIITEGVFDVWKLGKGNAVATFGTEYTLKQLRLLIEKGIEKVVIAFDSDVAGQHAADKLKGALEVLGIDCKKFACIEGDPADMNKKGIEHLIAILNKF